MRVIAHRGNLNGPSAYENAPDHLLRAINAGFDIEVDVWYVNREIWLGHDSPEYLVDSSFIEDIAQRAWFHCKNEDALFYLKDMGMHCFWHNIDNYTMTTDGIIWAYPGMKVNHMSIAVMPESVEEADISMAYGVCTDYPYEYA